MSGALEVCPICLRPRSLRPLKGVRTCSYIASGACLSDLRTKAAAWDDGDGPGWDVMYENGAGEWVRAHLRSVSRRVAEDLYDSQVYYRPSTERFRLVQVRTIMQTVKESEGRYNKDNG